MRLVLIEYVIYRLKYELRECEAQLHRSQNSFHIFKLDKVVIENTTVIWEKKKFEGFQNLFLCSLFSIFKNWTQKTHHDHSEWHCETRDTAEKRGRPDERHGTRVNPRPLKLVWYLWYVDTKPRDHKLPDNAAVESSDQPVSG